MIQSTTQRDEHIVLYDVTWRAYIRLLAAMESRRFRHTYADGVLEIMTLSPEHEWIKKLLARFIENLSIELKVRIMSVGSTTLKRKLKERGLEPDESYFVAGYGAMRGVKRLNLDRHAPPDLVVEIDVTHKAKDRLGIYAQFGVAEIWQHDAKGVRFLKLTSDSTYRSVKRSLAFPQVSSDDIQRFLDQRTKLDEFDLVNAFIAWARTIGQASNS
jgi:Uma2 family endonuclease